MQILDKLVVVTKTFSLSSLIEWFPELGNAIETFYLNEDTAEDDEEGISVADDLSETMRRAKELGTLLVKYESDISWLYDQVQKMAFEAKVQ